MQIKLFNVLYVRLLLAYIMIPLIQKELDIFKDTVWNSHRIRRQKDTILPDGIPNHIYAFPESYGLEQCGRLIMTNYHGKCPQSI
jgi:hypothetical protein